MASITRQSNGRKTIQFVAPDGKRRSIRLGKATMKTAQEVATKVEHLNAGILAGVAMDTDTARWVAEIGNDLAEKLTAVGLMPERQAKVKTALAAFLDEYIASRTDIKPLTIRHFKDAGKNLVGFFGGAKPLGDITSGDADEFRLHLLQRLGDNTVRRQCGRAKQFFRAAMRRRLIPQNPFGDMKGCGVRANKSREYFVTREMAQRVLDVCRDHEWKLLFGLARFGGLRIYQANW